MNKLLEIIGRLNPDEVPEGFVEVVTERITNEKENVWKQLRQLMGENAESQTEEADPIKHARRTALRGIARILKDEDELQWRHRLEGCETPEDYRAFFELLGIIPEIWQSYNALCDNGYNGLQKALAKKAGGKWTDFARLMNITKAPSFPQRVKACLTPADFHRLMDELKVPHEHRTAPLGPDRADARHVGR